MMSQTVVVPYLPFLQRLRASFAKLTLAGLLATGAAAPTWADQPAPVNEQVLRLVTANMPRSLDPINIDAQRIINNGFAEPLVHQSLDGARLIPALARSWTLVEPTLWRIELQPNARFWSGAAVDAEAVRAALERHQRANPRARALLQGASFRAAGPTTLEIRTAAPDPAFLFKTVTVGIHNAAAAEAMGDRFHREADLTGYFRPTRFIPGELIVGEPFEGHWGPRPRLSRIEARFVVDPQTRFLAMQAGEAEMDGNVQIEQRRAYLRLNRFNFPPVNSTTWNVWLNFRHPLLADAGIREALSLGVNRDEIVGGVLRPIAVHATGHFPAGLPYAIATRQLSDPARARQLLDELGWRPGPDGVRVRNGQRLEFRVLTYGWWHSAAVALEAQWRRIGVGITLRVVEPTASNQIMLDGDFEIATYCSCGSATGDLHGQLRAFYQTGVTQNWGRYSNPQVDALIDNLQGEFDEARRFDLARQIQTLVQRDHALIYVANSDLIGIAHAPRVRGADPDRPRDITPGMFIVAR
ncbi:MAG: ABC transporter substrate-binding protein [Rubrivivax sp.]